MERRMGWVVLNQFLESIYLRFEVRHENTNHRHEHTLFLQFSYTEFPVPLLCLDSYENVSLLLRGWSLYEVVEGSTCVSTEASFEK